MSCNCTKIKCKQFSADQALRIMPHLLCDIITGIETSTSDYETEGPLYDLVSGTATLLFNVTPNSFLIDVADISVAHPSDPFLAIFIETSWGEAAVLASIGGTQTFSLLRKPPSDEYEIYISVLTTKGNIFRWNCGVSWDGVTAFFDGTTSRAYTYLVTVGTCFRRLTNGTQTALVTAAGLPYVVVGTLNGSPAPSLEIPECNGIAPPIDDILPLSFVAIPVNDAVPTTLPIPFGALGAVIQIRITAGTGAVLFRVDGVAATPGVGFVGIGGTIIRLGKAADKQSQLTELANFSAICEIGTTGTLNVQFYL